MDIPFVTGIAGSLILLTGAAWPIRAVPHPARSTKNWLFAVGGAVMFAYSLLNYLAGGPIFFVILQVLVNFSSVLMMLNTDDRFDAAALGTACAAMIVWSLLLFEGYNTVFFIAGLSGIGIGYALDTGSLRRGAMLTAGSALIALFSYVEQSWIFFWLNVFFAIFSGYQLWCLWHRKQPRKI